MSGHHHKHKHHNKHKHKDSFPGYERAFNLVNKTGHDVYFELSDKDKSLLQEYVSHDGSYQFRAMQAHEYTLFVSCAIVGGSYRNGPRAEKKIRPKEGNLEFDITLTGGNLVIDTSVYYDTGAFGGSAKSHAPSKNELQ